jgi:hypothetical protein
VVCVYGIGSGKDENIFGVARRWKRAICVKNGNQDGKIIWWFDSFGEDPDRIAKQRQKKAFSVAGKFSGVRKSLFAPPDYFLTPEKPFFQLRKIFSRRKKPFFPVRKFSGDAKSLFLWPDLFPEPEKAFFWLQKIFSPQKKRFSEDNFASKCRSTPQLASLMGLAKNGNLTTEALVSSVQNGCPQGRSSSTAISQRPTLSPWAKLYLRCWVYSPVRPRVP